LGSVHLEIELYLRGLKEPLKSISIILYNYIPQVFLLEKHPKDCPPSLKEIMSLFGIGFKCANLERYFKRKRK
jgi:endonuclease III